MKTVKPLTLGLLHRAYRYRGANRMVVCVLGFFALNEPPAARLLPEPAQWARLMKVLPAGQVLDEVMPKAFAESIVFGEAFGPRGTRLRVNAIDQRGGPLGPVPMGDEARTRYAGTYDKQWLREDYPGLPRDVDWRLYNQAREDQRIADRFVAGEAYRLDGLDPGHAAVEGTLPAQRVRAFATTHDLAEPQALREIALRLDTLWFVPGIALGVAAWRGELQVQDSDALDVKALLIAYEDGASPALPLSRYVDVLRLRTDPATAGLHAFDESQLAPPQAPASPAAAGPPEPSVPATPAVPGAPVLTPPSPAQIAAGDMDLTALMQQVEQLKASVTRHAQEQMAMLPAVKPAQPEPAPAWDELLARAALPDEPAVLMNKARQASPVPLPSARPLPPESAARLGRQVREWALQGVPLAGRDLAGADLRGAALAGLDLRGCLFEYADLSRADLSGANLSGAVFTGAMLSCADLSGANLDSANLCGSVAHETSFQRAVLRNARASSAQWRGANACQTDLAGAMLDKADLSLASFDEAQLDGTLLSEAVATASSWRHARVNRCIAWKLQATGADFSHSTWLRSALIGSDLTGSRWQGASLTQVQGGNAQWADCDLRAARADRSAWTAARMRGINLTGALLSNCDFSRADLAGATLQDGCFARSLFMQAELGHASAPRADFFQAILRKADFSDADLTQANLYQAEMTETRLVHTRTDGVRLHARGMQ